MEEEEDKVKHIDVDTYKISEINREYDRAFKQVAKPLDILKIKEELFDIENSNNLIDKENLLNIDLQNKKFEKKVRKWTNYKK
jgi:hypothetical protein